MKSNEIRSVYCRISYDIIATKQSLKDYDLKNKKGVGAMENQEFQELVIAHFKEVSKNFGNLNHKFDQIDQRFDQIDHKFDQIDHKFDQIEKRLDQIDQRLDHLDGRLNSVEELIRQHHEELEEVATQIEQSVVSQVSFQTETRNTLEKMQYDINYLVRKTSTHDDDIIQLKKAK